VRGVDDLHRLLTDERVGVTATMTLLRLGEKMAIDVTPAETPR
jgi:hypothetical protein